MLKISNIRDMPLICLLLIIALLNVYFADLGCHFPVLGPFQVDVLIIYD